MDEEQQLVSQALELYEKAIVRLGKYMEMIPKASIKGIAQHLSRQYFKQNPGQKLSDEERLKLAHLICANIFDEVLKKAHTVVSVGKDGTGNVIFSQSKPVIQADRDGAQLFYRRALNKMAMESFPDAERLLKRAVEIDPSFIDAWDALVDVYEKNEKEELAQAARDKMRELKAQS